MHMRESIAEVACPKCEEKLLAKTYSPTSRLRQERTWDETNGMSHQYRFDPTDVAGCRKRLGKRAASMLRDNGEVFFTNRREARLFRLEVERCQREDQEDLAKLMAQHNR